MMPYPTYFLERVEMKLDGSSVETVCGGIRNAYDVVFNEYGDLITSNTVLAHLWHIVPGMYCERRASEQDNPYAYGRIQTIANHPVPDAFARLPDCSLAATNQNASG